MLYGMILGAPKKFPSYAITITISVIVFLVAQQSLAQDFMFSRTLRRGSSGEDVRRLQEFLKNPPAGGPEIYPEGLVTGYLGSLTEAAVKRFQAKYGIVFYGDPVSTGYGLVGPKTRAKLNEIAFSPAGKPPQQQSETTTAPGAIRIPNPALCPDNI